MNNVFFKVVWEGKAQTMKRQQSEEGGYVKRARRYFLQMPIEFRQAGDVEWSEGTAINISRSGVLFQSIRLLQMGTKVEIMIDLPVARLGEPLVHLKGRGIVVRHAASAERYHAPVMAVAVRDFRFPRRTSMGAGSSTR